MSKKEKITITIDQEVNVLIRELADKHDRPLSTEINRALKNYIKEKKEREK